MDSENKLSVIMPVFNVEAFLDKSISSVLAQSYKKLEIILIDDGSTDNSGSICKKYAEQDPRIVLIRTENRGVSAARNKGLSVATGNYITFVDSDDWVEADAYERLIKFMKENKAGIGIIGITLEEKDYSSIYLKKSPSLVLHQNEAVARLIEGDILGWNVWNKIYSKEILKDAKFDLRIDYCEDLLFNWHNFSKAKTIVYLSMHAYHYVQRSTSVCHHFSKKNLTVVNVFKEIMNDCLDNKVLYQLVKKKFLLYLIILLKLYFSQDKCSIFKYEFEELKQIQAFIRHEFWFIFLQKNTIFFKTAALVVMAPVPITYLVVKLYNGMNRILGRNQAV